MEARSVRGWYYLLALLCLSFTTGASYKTPNFVVSAATPELAEKIGRMAERYRHTLAIAWTGKPMPDWSQPCPIKAIVNPKLGAGGETSFVFDRNEVYGWKMEIRGTEERVLDSVLPHEVTHTIFASYFRRPLPRWADEGACTTMEHESERGKHYRLLQHFLRNNRGIPFSDMFVMKQYPQDILPLYAQGYSLARFLIQQGGRPQFIEFLSAGMERDEWTKVVKKYYGYQSLAELQNKWLSWVEKGCPELPTATADSKEGAPTELQAWPDRPELAQTPVVRGQSIDNTASSRTPVSNGDPFLQNVAATTVVPPTKFEELPTAAVMPAIHLSPNMTSEPQTAARSIYDRSQPNWQRESAPPPLVNTPAAAMIQPVPGTLQPLVPPSHLTPTPVMAQQLSPPPASNTDHKVLLEWGTPEPKLDLRW